MFYCDNYISNSEDEQKKLKTELFHSKLRALTMKNKSHTTMIYARFHSSQCNSLRRLAGILHSPCFQ